MIMTATALTVSHFLAVIQTEFQREMLERHCGNGSIIDATYRAAKFKKVKTSKTIYIR
jgi:hypothetical protein